MAKVSSPVEFTSFTGGINTEASRLNFPPDATIDERNFTLDRKGFRNKRKGLVYHNDTGVLTKIMDTPATPDPASTTHDIPTSTFLWKDAGRTGQEILVTHVSNQLSFSRVNDDGKLVALQYYTLSYMPTSMASVDGKLLVASDSPTISLYQFDGLSITNPTSVSLKVRDFWGVGAVQGPFSGDVYQDLRSEEFLDLRPRSVLTESYFQAHLYNLRNQGWAQFKLDYKNTIDPGLPRDPISVFLEGRPSGTLIRYPSNSENPTRFVYANTDIGPELRFNGVDAYSFLPPKEETGRGHFFIDPLDRGASREDAIDSYQARVNFDDSNGIRGSLNFTYDSGLGNIPADRTEGGVTVLGSYAGRAWYGGINGANISPDRHSPDLKNYVFFSRLVSSEADLGKCYQLGDPTSFDASDIVDTDGGYIQVSGMGKLLHMETVGGSLLLFADNGVWQIAGGSDVGFTATAYRVNKITSYGCISKKSIVVLGSAISYWSLDGIQLLTDSGEGVFSTANLSSDRIKTLYNDIDVESKTYASGFYDEVEGKLSWIYNPVNSGSRKLTLDLKLGSFSLYEYAFGSPDWKQPRLFEEVYSPSTKYTGTEVEQIDSVKLNLSTFQDVPDSSMFSAYCTETGEDFVDWVEVDLPGTIAPTGTADVEAYLLTGYITGGDTQRYKQVPYLTTHFNKTETGFVDEGADFSVIGESSCLVQVQWEWANSPNSGRWSPTFQAYRHKRHYFPVDVNDGFDDGFSVVTTKNKLRGKGRALSLLFNTEPGKDCQILGWAMSIGVAGGI